MNAFRFSFGCGWEDDRPPDIKRMIQTYRPDDYLAALGISADTHVGSLVRLNDSPFGWGRDGAKETDIVARALITIPKFLETLQSPDTDVASLMLFNFRPQTFDLAPRPPGRRIDVPLLDGIGLFSEAAANSLLPSGPWSACEWAMLSGTRIG